MTTPLVVGVGLLCLAAFAAVTTATPRAAQWWCAHWYVREVWAVWVPVTAALWGGLLVLDSAPGVPAGLREALFAKDNVVVPFVAGAVPFLVLPGLILSGASLTRWLGPPWLRRLIRRERGLEPTTPDPGRRHRIATPTGALDVVAPRDWSRRRRLPAGALFRATVPSLHSRTPTTCTIGTDSTPPPGTLIHQAATRLGGHPARYTVTLVESPGAPATTHTWSTTHRGTSYVLTITTPTCDHAAITEQASLLTDTWTWRDDATDGPT